MNWNEFLFRRMLIAVPELYLDIDYWRVAQSLGIISKNESDAAQRVIREATRAGRAAGRLKGLGTYERIMLVAPGLLSVQTVDFLRSFNLIPVQQANSLRLALRAANLLTPQVLSGETIGARLAVAMDSGSRDLINYLRGLDDARLVEIRNIILSGTNRARLTPDEAAPLRAALEESVKIANAMRAAVALGKIGQSTIADAAHARDAWGAVAVFGRALLSDAVLKNAIRLGTIPADRYDMIRALEVFGLNVWQKVSAAGHYESFAARSLLISEGILSPEMIRVLRELGVISPRVATLSYPAAIAIRGITRSQVARIEGSAGRRFRVLSGESPIRTYARAAQATDKAILGLLADAAKDAAKESEKLAKSKKFGALTRAAQQKLVQKSLNDQMHVLWEGVGHLTIFGEKQTALAAVESMDFLNRRLWRSVNGERTYEETIAAQARAGVDSYISREENVRELSSRVYKNLALSQGRVAREIQKALLRGVGARDLAKIVAADIRPGVKGGTSYAAMRLARTEINNAFHFSSIRHTREMPWVEGYRWHTSGSHPAPDICNTYEEKNHDGLGAGVFSKRRVPGKPHPNCLCYITPESVSNGDFERRLRSGAYNRYINDMDQTGSFGQRSVGDARGTVQDAALTTLQSELRKALTEIAKITASVVVSSALF